MDLRGLSDWVKHVVGRQRHFPHQMAFVLESPLRRLLVTPAELADRLHLQRSSRVLEVGAGSGVFSVEVARRVPDGHLELFDLQPEMLAKCRGKLEQAGLAGVVGYTQGDAEALPFPAASFDVAFLVAVLGEIPDPRRCLAGLRRILRPGGLLSITEHLPDPDFARFSSVRRLVEQEGFAFDERFGTPWAFTANFRVPEAAGESAAIDAARRERRA